MNTDTILLEHELKLKTVAEALAMDKKNIEKLNKKIMHLRKGNLLLVAVLVTTVIMISDLQHQVNEAKRIQNEE